MQGKFEKPIEEPPEFSQEKIEQLRDIELDQVRKGDFAMVNGNFEQIEHVEWKGKGQGPDGFVVFKDGKRRKIDAVKAYKKNPERP